MTLISKLYELSEVFDDDIVLLSEQMAKGSKLKQKVILCAIENLNVKKIEFEIEYFYTKRVELKKNMQSSIFDYGVEYQD